MKLKYCMSRNSNYYIMYSLVLLVLATLLLPWTSAQSGDGDDFKTFDDDEDQHGSDSIIDHILNPNTNHTDESSHIIIVNSTSSPPVVHFAKGVVEDGRNETETVKKTEDSDLFLEGEQEDDKNKTHGGGNSTIVISPRDGESSDSVIKSSTMQIILVVVGSLMLILICFIWRLLCLKRKRRKAKQRRIALSNQILGNDKNQGRELLEIKHNNGQDTYGVLSKPTVVPITDADELQPMMVSSNYPRREEEPENEKPEEKTKHEIEEEEKRPVLPPKQSRYTRDSLDSASDSTSPNTSKSPMSKAREDFLSSRPSPVTASFTTTATVEKVHLPTKNTNRPVSPPPSYDEYIRASNDQLNNTKDRDSLGLTDLGPTYR